MSAKTKTVKQITITFTAEEWKQIQDTFKKGQRQMGVKWIGDYEDVALAAVGKCMKDDLLNGDLALDMFEGDWYDEIEQEDVDE